MKYRMFNDAGLAVLALALACISPAGAVDFESFEFNDPTETPLGSAFNTANPGNFWSEDPDMQPSDIRGGVYNIVKPNPGLDSNYLQIDNITSGTRYLVARMSGWDFFQNSPSDPNEEFRLAFLNDDTGTSGATITAQMNIRRDAGGSGNIVLVGSAIGTGSTDIAGAPVLNTTQTNPFTIALELNKNSNSYKVFYKDGGNPTQVLGLGAVAPSRDGNSVRMAVNNDFGNFSQDYPIDFFEVFSVDRIALTDTNPFTDLLSLEVDRVNASMTLRNTSGATLSNIESYSITSGSGSLNPAGWSSTNQNASVSTDLERTASFTAPVTLTNNGTLTLSMGSGAWQKGPFEDLQMVLNLTGGGTRTVNVNFLNNGGIKWPVADFNLNNMVDANDWLTFIAGAETDLGGFTLLEAYQAGDLDGDGMNSIGDFVQFKTLFDADNGGAGAFEAMLAGLAVPEPSSFLLLGTAAFFWTMPRRRAATTAQAIRSWPSQTSHEPAPTGELTMPPIFRLSPVILVAMVMFAVVPCARAVDLEDFPFNDDNGTLIEDAANVINPTNTFLVDGDLTNSSIQNGALHVRKDNENLATSVADITNNISSGKGWIVAEIDGWRYNSEQSAGNFDPGSLEQFRITFLDNDSGLSSGSSFVTAEARIQRASTGGLELFGTALGGGGTITGPQPTLNLNQTEPFTFVLELDKNADQYSIFFKSASDTNFSQFGTATATSSTRAGNSLRVSFNGNYSGTDAGLNDEFFDLDRVYVTTTNPLDTPIDPTTLTLEVKSNGQVSIKNATASAITFNSYRISFTDPLTMDLNFAGWNSLSDQGIDAVLGGDDPGETWDEAGGSDDQVLAESFLLGSTTIPTGEPNNSLSLGSAFSPAGAHEELVFQYHDTMSGSIVTGEIEFVVVAGIDGDYNDDGTVDAADYVIWRKNIGTTNSLPNDPSGGTIGTAQYNTWRDNFGMSGGSGSEGISAPEPAAWLLACLMAAGWLAPPRRCR